MRTTDVNYGPDYWNTLDGGAGYQDSVMWEDLAVITKELFCYDGPRDMGGHTHHLDIGCAAGYLSKHLRRRGVDSHGCDGSAYILGTADAYIAPFIHEWDLTSLNLIPDWSSVGFNLITCFETMEHIPEEFVQGVVNRIYNRLGRGGRALFAICTDDRPGWDSDPTHVTIHSRGWWSDVLFELPWTFDEERYEKLKKFHLFADHSGIFTMVKP